ncbi:ribosome-associated, sigma 54 modulation protein [Legionella beliardensis]|uniref:Ribosome hibernation promoting factor n=1 Tax=Legionella beliardensis TaxID=91822 RepID=A0A378HZ55_9GAMM|nr:ribosome-associated translation inhibitor RaiA [Legionella beliardensis]STX28032.1 ribosome-associated, sigma 54 modulation protein [Legionella beliardensis]
MQINFTGHQMEVTPALRAYTEDKFAKLMHHFDNITAIHVVFNIEKLAQIAEATIHVAKGTIHASAQHDDMYIAINDLVDKLDQQLIKHKEKLRAH